MQPHRIAIFLASLLTAIPSVRAADVKLTPPAGAESTNSPSIQFGESGIYEFGNVQEGAMVHHSFIFTNNGNAPLRIGSVNTTCSCTTVEDWSKDVPPGATGTITLKVNTSYLSGGVEKSAVVLCNDPRHPQMMVEMKGVVVRPIVVSPQTLTLTVVTDMTNSVSGAVNILDNEDRPLTLSTPQCDNPYFVAELKTIRDGREYRLDIHTEPGKQSGNLHGRIIIKTSLPDKPEIEINAFAAVQPAIMTMPAQILLSDVSREPTRQTVCIVNNRPDALVLSDPRVNAPADVSIENAVPGHQFIATITFPGGFHVSSHQAIEFTVKTSNPRFPVIRIPIRDASTEAPAL